MPCLNIKRFQNPIKDSKRGPFDKFTIQGQCGHCAGCNKRKQNDWLVRGYFEYLSKPHDCFFVTLDFDEQHLPSYNGVPCFDSELMHGFFEVLRQALPPFRYLYSSHLGEAMNRPHYHVMFFFDKDSISDIDFWSVINRLWKYGQHEDIKQLRSVRDSHLKGIEYVCKYTTRRSLSYEFKKMPKRYRQKILGVTTKSSFGTISRKQIGIKYPKSEVVTW